MNLKVGDLVQYLSSKEIMVIEKIDGNNVTCGWMIKKKKWSVVFNIETLIKYEGPPMGFKG